MALWSFYGITSVTDVSRVSPFRVPLMVKGNVPGWFLAVTVRIVLPVGTTEVGLKV